MKRRKNHWNYRIVTTLFSYKKEYEKNDTMLSKSFAERPDERLFSIVEVYYRDNKPDSYTDKGMLYDLESKKDLKWAHKKIKKAFKKPILDLDNWPAKWKKTE